MKVLVVDDHDANRAILARRLTRRGFEVVEAQDGASVAGLCASTRPDCILMDLSMPAVNGFEALSRVQANPATADIPAIALTAHALDEIKAKCMASGFRGFQTKPVDFEHLVASITALAARTS